MFLSIINPFIDKLLGTGGTEKGAEIVGKIIGGLIGIFFVIGFVLSLLHFVFASIKWITAGGDKSQLENARERMIQALVGLILLAAVWAVMKVVGTIIGIDFPVLKIPKITDL